MTEVVPQWKQALIDKRKQQAAAAAAKAPPPPSIIPQWKKDLALRKQANVEAANPPVKPGIVNDAAVRRVVSPTTRAASPGFPRPSQTAQLAPGVRAPVAVANARQLLEKVAAIRDGNVVKPAAVRPLSSSVEAAAPAPPPPPPPSKLCITPEEVPSLILVKANWDAKLGAKKKLTTGSFADTVIERLQAGRSVADEIGRVASTLYRTCPPTLVSVR
eukprot:m.535555 g.535555  ORF g.535555 m.535555 type:complete len:217 (+) comp57617_c0_seq3:28-678(+)